MAAVTLARLMYRARNRADMKDSPFVDDEELTDYINEGAKRLHELVAAAYGNEYAKKESAGTWSAGVADIALPTDFFKLTGMDLTINGKAVSLHRYEEQERNKWRNLASTSWLSIPRYKLENARIKLLPVPTASFPYTMFYIPLLQVTQNAGGAIVNEFTYTATADTINFPNGWEKFVTLYAAIECLDKEESSVSERQRKLNKWEAELIQIAENRDAGQPMSAIDVENTEVDPRWW